jgi:hypothetical protein
MQDVVTPIHRLVVRVQESQPPAPLPTVHRDARMEAARQGGGMPSRRHLVCLHTKHEATQAGLDYDHQELQKLGR